MIYTEITKNKNGMINLDGYSNKKTVKGAYNDLMKEVAKINKDEVISYEDNKEIINVKSSNEYEIEISEVGCASTYNDYGEAEYKDANYYCYIRFIAC